MINVTKTFLPPFQEYTNILSRAWDKGWITNRGELVLELEKELKEYLKCKNILLTTNGTLPLQIAIKALKLNGEIITTPFSYVATTSSIVWEGCKPVFVDIESDYLTIDADKIEAAITPKTSAILATHVFGNPCEVEKIRAIAKKYDLRVIYDGAHCFGVKYKGKCIFDYGDVSSCSFHATKIFHTGEGGALFCTDDLIKTMYLHHNFGHDGEDNFNGLGINAKMSELQAAMGLSVLKYVDYLIEARKKIFQTYTEKLNHIPDLILPKIRPETTYNYAYYPIIFRSEEHLVKVKSILNAKNVFPRRYFYPSLNTLDYLEYQKCEVSEGIAKKILCLPIYHDLKNDDFNQIVEILGHEDNIN